MPIMWHLLRLQTPLLRKLCRPEMTTGKQGRFPGEGGIGELNLTTSQEACLMSIGSEDRRTAMNDYFEVELPSLDETRLAKFPVMPTRDVEDILSAQVPLSDTSARETEKIGSLSVDKELRLSRGAEASNPIKRPFLIHSRRRSIMFEESPRNCKTPTSSRVTFGIGNEKTPVANRDIFGEASCSRPQTGNELARTDVRLR